MKLKKNHGTFLYVRGLYTLNNKGFNKKKNLLAAQKPVEEGTLCERLWQHNGTPSAPWNKKNSLEKSKVGFVR